MDAKGDLVDEEDHHHPVEYQDTLSVLNRTLLTSLEPFTSYNVEVVKGVKKCARNFLLALGLSIGVYFTFVLL